VSRSAFKVSRTSFEQRWVKRAPLAGRKRIQQERPLVVVSQWALPPPQLRVVTHGPSCSRESSKSTRFAAPAVGSGCAFLPPLRIPQWRGGSWHAWGCHPEPRLSHRRPHPSPQRAPGLAALRLMTLIRRHRSSGTRVDDRIREPT
jgi:hypothetical protein